MRKVRLGSRASPLALRQAEIVSKYLEGQYSHVSTEIETFRTSGDNPQSLLNTAVLSVKRMFVKEIEEALLEGKVDLAVHSLKDLPCHLPEGLCLAAIPAREDPRDVMISSSKNRDLDDLPKNGTIGTSSLRRTVQLRFLRSDLKILPVRGNVQTRIRKMEEDGLDGIVLAAAGLKRLGLENRIAFSFSPDKMLPAIGQGALAIECRSEDHDLQQLLSALNHTQTHVCVMAERCFLERMGGGCQVPMGAYASLTAKGSLFQSFIASPYRAKFLRYTEKCQQEDLRDIALKAAENLLDRGGSSILQELEERGPL